MLALACARGPRAGTLRQRLPEDHAARPESEPALLGNRRVARLGFLFLSAVFGFGSSSDPTNDMRVGKTDP